MWLSPVGSGNGGGIGGEGACDARHARDAAKASGYERARCAALANIVFPEHVDSEIASRPTAAFREIADAVPKGGTLVVLLFSEFAGLSMVALPLVEL